MHLKSGEEIDNIVFYTLDAKSVTVEHIDEQSSLREV